MSDTRGHKITFFAAVAILTMLTTGCMGFDTTDFLLGGPEDQPQPAAEQSPAVAEPATTPEGSSESIVFAFSGANPAYHTGLLNKTKVYLNYDGSTALANESRQFEEPAGDIQTRLGTDSVQFNGTYDHTNKTIHGTLTIRTDGRSSGGEASASNITYLMTGTLDAKLIGEEWTGTVVGNSTLTQSWEDGASSDEETRRPVDWSLTSVSIEKF